MQANQPFTLTEKDFDNWDNKQKLPQQNQNNIPVSNISSNLGSLFTPNLNNPEANFIFGAGDAMRNSLASAMNIIPGVNVPRVTNGQGTAYNAGNVAGNIGTFIGGGEGLDAIRELSEGIPMIGKAAQYLGQEGLPSILNRTIGSGLSGLLTNQDNRLQNAGESAGISAALDTLPSMLGVAGKILSPIASQYKNYLSPDSYASDIINNISGGKGLEQSGKDIAEQIKNNYKNAKDDGGKLFDNLSDQFGDIKLFDNPVNSEYATLPNTITNNFDNKLSELHNNFISDPTLDNAIDLRRQISSGIGAWDRKNKLSGLSPYELSNLTYLRNAQSSLESDMGNLFNQYPIAGQMFDDANFNWQKNVVPYEEDNDIYNMATGKIKNPTNIGSIFRSPEDHTVKVISDLPTDSRNSIVYSAMGSPSAQKSAINLLNTYKALDQKRLSSYVSPELQQSMDKLSSGISTRDTLNKILGAAIGSHIPGMSPEIGAIAGYQVAPFLSKLFNASPKTLNTTISNLPTGIFPYLRTAIVPNIHTGVSKNGTQS